MFKTAAFSPVLVFLGFLFLINNAIATDVSIKANPIPQALLQLNVIDVKEAWLKDKKALSIIFSHKLAKKSDYSNFVTATINGVSLKSHWVYTKNAPYRLYLTNIQANQKYEIFIRPGIRSVNGLKLLKPKHFNIMTQTTPASIDLLDHQKSFSSQQLPKLQLQTQNVKQYDAHLYRLNTDKIDQFTQKLQYSDQLSKWQTDEISQFSDFIQKRTISLDERAENQRFTSQIQLKPENQSLKSGLYFVSIKARTSAETQLNQLFYFTISDIALHIDNLSSSTEILSYSKSKAKLLPKIKFSLISPQEISIETTDKQGRSQFGLRDRPYVSWLVVIPTKANQQQFVLQKIPLRKKVYQEILNDSAHIFLNKRNYKIGERIDFSILLRDKKNRAIADQVLYVKLLDEKQNLIDKQAIITPELGSISNFFQLPIAKKTAKVEIEIPSSDTKKIIQPEPKLDVKNKIVKQRKTQKIPDKSPWSVQVYLNEQDENPLSTAKFYVGATDFLDAQVNIMTDETVIGVDTNVPFLLKGYVDEYISPENLEVVIERQIDWQASASKKYKKYHFGTEIDKTLQGSEILQRLHLDKRGQAKFSLPKIKNDLHSILSVHLKAEMLIEQHAVARESETLQYWPAESMIGVYKLVENIIEKQETVEKTEEKIDIVAKKDYSQQFELININQNNDLLAANKILIKLFKLSQPTILHKHSLLEKNQPHNQSFLKEKLIKNNTLSWQKNKKGKVLFNLKYGHYRLETINPDTDLRSEYYFSIGTKNQNFSANQLQLSLDKLCYQKNEIARLNITSPIDTDAIIRIASDHVHWAKRVQLKQGENTVDIPIIKQLSDKKQNISVLGFTKSNHVNSYLKGNLPLLLKSLQTPLQIEPLKGGDWQSLRLHSEMYKNKEAIVVLGRSKGNEVLLPEIMPLIQRVNFDEDGDAILNNSEAKIDAEQKYYATLYFVDKTIEGLNVEFTSSPLQFD